MVKLCEVVTYRKQFIEINDLEIYKRCRVQLHRRGVKLRDRISGSGIKTKKQRLCKSDDFIVAEMDAKFGGYGIIPEELNGAIVSSHYYLYELDKSKLLPAFLIVIIDSGIFDEQIKAIGSTNYSRVSAKEILEYEIPCPSLDDQRIIIEFYFTSKEKCFDLGSELTNQQSLLKKLRQQILQEAIEGKLTADWRAQNPNIEPASELLARIKAEKEQLIKDKKIKKQKALPPITDEEKPFDLPDGWEWCVLGDISNLLNGYAFKSKWFTKEGVKLVRNTNISHGVLNWNEKAFISHEMSEKYNRFLLEEGDTVLSLDRPIISTGLKAARIQRIDLPCLLLQRVLLIKSIFVCEHYVFKWLFSELFLGSINPGRSIGVPHVSHNEVMSAPFPLPSLPEQKAIVTKVEKLFTLCDQLESQITQNQNHAKQLMQAVLKEAFQQDRNGKRNRV